MTEKRPRFLARFKFVFWGTGFAQFAKFFTFAVMAKFLSPESYGYFQIFVTLQTYLSNCNLGVLNALNRNVPFHIGRKEFSLATLTQENSLRFTFLISFVFSFIAFASSFFIRGDLRPCLIANAVVLLFQQLYLYVEFSLKSQQQFPKLFKFQSFFSINMIIFCWFFGKLFHLAGLYFAYLLTFINCFLFAFFFLRMRVVDLQFNKIDFKRILSLVKVGFPIMVIGFTYQILLTLDRFIILHFYSAKEVGYYSLMNIVNGVMQLIAMAVSTVLYPEVMEKLGNKETYWDVFRRLLKFVNYSFFVFMGFGLLLLVIVPFVVKKYYVEYLPFLSVFRVILMGLVFINLNYFNGIFFNATKKQIKFIFIQLGAIFFAIVVNIILCTRYNFGILGVACVFLATSILNYVCSTLYAWRIASNNRDGYQKA